MPGSVKVALLVCALLVGGAGYAVWGAHQAAEAERARMAAQDQAVTDAIRTSARLLGQLSLSEIAADNCAARARNAAAVHGADPARVREACMAGWRSTGVMPQP